MIDQNQLLNPSPVPASTAPIAPIQVPPTLPKWKSILEKVRLIAKNGWDKFYSNKKIFWPVAIAFGLMLLIIILGLIFGSVRMNKSASLKPSPTSVIEASPQASASGDILTTSSSKLSDLKNQINNLDVKESRLKPPAINYDIKF